MKLDQLERKIAESKAALEKLETKASNIRFVADNAGTMTIEEIASHLDISTGTVRNIAKSNDIVFTDRRESVERLPSELKREDYLRILELSKGGMSARQIGMKVGISNTEVSLVIKFAEIFGVENK